MRQYPLLSVLALGTLVVPAENSRADAPPGLGSAAAILAVTPRTNLPPEDSDPARPPNTRLFLPKRQVWTDDAGHDDTGGTFDWYQRTSLGTWSNYDQSLANPFPLPDPLVMKDGQPVRDAATWWNRRRPEILGDYLTEVYGVIPADTPKVTWEVTSVEEVGGVRKKTIVGHIDNSAYPAATPEIELTLTTPAGASGPVPVIVLIGGGGPPRRGAAAAAPTPTPATVLAHYPTSESPQDEILARGWGYATYRPTSVQADNAQGLTAGIIGLMSKGMARKNPDEWGALSAWAWGLSRTIDYFETDRDVDAKRLGVEGHSRFGKTALWAEVVDPRWAIAYVSCSGEGGAKPLRRNFGETTDNIAGSHWMAAGFRRFGGHWNDIPVDSNELIALVAPRPVFVTGATQDPWSDPTGEFMAVVGAGPVYRLLGKSDVGATAMPAPNVGLISGDLGFREHVGYHTDINDWPTFLDFASRYFRPQARD